MYGQNEFIVLKLWAEHQKERESQAALSAQIRAAKRARTSPPRPLLNKLAARTRQMVHKLRAS